MIKSFKIFEDLQTPQVNDYVVAKINNLGYILADSKSKIKLDNWVNNNIGQEKQKKNITYETLKTL